MNTVPDHSGIIDYKAEISTDIDENYRTFKWIFKNDDTVIIRIFENRSDLKFEFFRLGTRINTLVCVAYVESLVDKKALTEFLRRIKVIKTDGVLDTNYIDEQIKDRLFSPFKPCGYTEKTDVARISANKGCLFPSATRKNENASDFRNSSFGWELSGIFHEGKRSAELNKKVCGNCYNYDYDGYVFGNELGERMRPNYLTEYFPKFIQKHGMPKMRFHDLRHSCASLLLANGVPLNQIQEWLGHSDFTTTANIYAHLDYSSKITSAQAMETGLALPESGDFGSRWEDMTDQGENKEPNMNPDSD